MNWGKTLFSGQIGQNMVRNKHGIANFHFGDHLAPNGIPRYFPLGFQNFKRRLILPKIEKSWRFVKSFVHLFRLCMCVCEGRSFGLNSLEFLSLILFHPLAHFITVLTARIESPTRKELKTHKTFHSPTHQTFYPESSLDS